MFGGLFSQRKILFYYKIIFYFLLLNITHEKKNIIINIIKWCSYIKTKDTNVICNSSQNNYSAMPWGILIWKSTNLTLSFSGLMLFFIFYCLFLSLVTTLHFTPSYTSNINNESAEKWAAGKFIFSSFHDEAWSVSLLAASTLCTK